QLSTSEWGIDVPLSAGTPVYAPENGTLIMYQGCPKGSLCWYPGRLLERLDSNGAIVGFGHVRPTLAVPGYAPTACSASRPHVAAGQQIASIAADAAGGPHAEFMYDVSGSSYGSCGSSNAGSWHAFLPPPTVQPVHGCPHQTWSGSGGTGADPCAVLKMFMNGL